MTQQVLILIVLLAVGLAMVALEILTPSFGLATLLALLALGWAVWIAFGISSVFGWVLLVSLVVAMPAYVGLMFKLLPKLGFSRRLFLGRGREPEGSGVPESARNAALVGKRGVAETLLRPSGMIRVDAQRVPALAEMGVIQPGEPVIVVRAGETEVVVRAVKD